MPINYGDVVSYSAGDGTNWQVNPARILQIRTATGSVSNESRSDYTNVTSVQMKRTKRDSIFYAVIAGRVSSLTTESGTTVYESYGSYSYRALFPRYSTTIIYDSAGNIIYQNSYVLFENRHTNNTHATWQSVNGVGTGSRVIIWQGTTVYSDNSTSDFATGDEFTGNDSYSYKIGDLRSTTTLNNDPITNQPYAAPRLTRRYEVARKYNIGTFVPADPGLPELRIEMSRMDGSYSRTLGGSWSADDEFNLPTQNSGLPRGEATFELSDFYQPTESYYPNGSTVFIQFQVKNSYSASSGIINVGQNCQYFNVASLRVYEIDNGTSTFIMKPDDAVFEDQGGAAAPTYPEYMAGASDNSVFSTSNTLGYGIPNSWWINRNIMYSPGVRCLIPNHNVAGEWVAFGEGYMRYDGYISFSDYPEPGDGEAYDTAFSHMLTYRGEMAGMITSDNGVTWDEMKGSKGDVPDASSAVYNPPIVFDWATNGDTDPREAVWLIGGYERERKDTDLSSSYDDDYDYICIYRNDISSSSYSPNDFDEWERREIPREDRTDNDENKIPQYISAICYSNGYFVAGNNWGNTNRLSESDAKEYFSSTFRNGWTGWYSHVSANQNLGAVNCLTSNDGGSKIVAGYNTKMLYSDDGGVSWDETYGYNNNDPTQAVVNWDTGFGGSSYQIKAIYNVTYIKDEVYVGNVKKGPGVWVACGFKSPTTTSLNSTKVPFYLYSENGEYWIEIDVQNDTNLPHAYPYNIRERITYTGNGTLMTWAGAGPGPSGPKSDSSAGSGSTYNKQADSYKLGSGLVHNVVGDSVPGVRDPYGNPDSADNQWDTSKASFWVSHGSLTDWVQVSSGTPFIGGSYSGTANAPTDVGDSGPGNTSAPNVFQMKADGWSHGRYMVASVGDEVYNKAGGRIAFIDIPE